MRQLTLTEYQTTESVRLSPTEMALMSDVIPSLTIAPSSTGTDAYDLTPGSWIGAYAIGDMAVTVSPKLPIDRVFFLISYAMDPKTWTMSEIDLGAAVGLYEAVVPALRTHLQRAFRRGLLQGYETRDEALQVVRGRIRFDAQIRDRYGVSPPIEVRHDEYTVDIEINRILRAAVNRLGKLQLRSAESRNALRSFDALMAEVSSVEYDRLRLPIVPWTRLNEHYRPAVNLAKLILSGSMLESQRGEIAGRGFSIDMNRVFEDFVVVALREALGLNPMAFPQGDGRLRLDARRRVVLRPDLSWWAGERCVFVGDVKYKRIKAAGILHPDLYQLLAYTVAADLSAGLLIYAEGELEDAVHSVVHVDKRLEVVTLDLAGSPSAILAQIGAIADRVTSLRDLRSMLTAV